MSEYYNRRICNLQQYMFYYCQSFEMSGMGRDLVMSPIVLLELHCTIQRLIVRLINY